jgi:hypothetical protein
MFAREEPLTRRLTAFGATLSRRGEGKERCWIGSIKQLRSATFRCVPYERRERCRDVGTKTRARFPLSPCGRGWLVASAGEQRAG